MGKTWEEIPPHAKAAIDRDLAAARNNLRLHRLDVQRHVDGGDSAEKVFAGLASELLRNYRNAPHHLSVMVSVGALTLVEQEREREAAEDLEFRLTEFTIGVRTIGTMPVFDQVHVKCRGGRFVIPIDQEPGPMLFRVAALDHLRKCDA